MVELHLAILKVTENSLSGIRSALSFGKAKHVLKHGRVRNVYAGTGERDNSGH